MTAFKWDHVHIRTFDVAATVAWFERVFGAQLVPGTSLDNARTDLLLAGGKLIITQVKADDGTNSTPLFPYAGLEHFGLECRDIDKVATELRAKGAEIARGPTTISPGLRVCYLRSPQGIIVEILERNNAYELS